MMPIALMSSTGNACGGAGGTTREPRERDATDEDIAVSKELAQGQGGGLLQHFPQAMHSNEYALIPASPWPAYRVLILREDKTSDVVGLIDADELRDLCRVGIAGAHGKHVLPRRARIFDADAVAARTQTKARGVARRSSRRSSPCRAHRRALHDRCGERSN